MKNKLGITSAFCVLVLVFASGPVSSQDQVFNVTVDKSINGTLKIDPPPIADGKYAAGTELTLPPMNHGMMRSPPFIISLESKKGRFPLSHSRH